MSLTLLKYRFLSSSPLSLSSVWSLYITKTVFFKWSQFFLVPIYFIVLQNYTILFSPPKIIWYLLWTTVSCQNYFVWFSRSYYQFLKSALLTRHPQLSLSLPPLRVISSLSLCSRVFSIWYGFPVHHHPFPWDCHFHMVFSNHLHASCLSASIRL